MLGAFVILLIFVLGAHGQPCTTENDLRLVQGYGEWEGNVQICYNGQWGAVCDNSWNMADAQVVCRQLGYSASTGVEYRLYSYYGYIGQENTVLDNVNCVGNENKLSDCPAGEALGTGVCGPSEMAGVFCGYGKSCTSGSIRLANDYIASRGRSEGRVEYCKGGTWVYICAYPSWTWSTPDSRVACRQLKFTSTTVDSVYWGGGYFGYGFLNPGYSYMGCSGSETSLASCTKSSTSYCVSRYYSAGVRCRSTNSGCVNGAIRLFSAFDHPANEGVLQICNSGTWYHMCRYYASCYIAKTACVQLGYKGAIGIRPNGGFYYGYGQYNDPYRYYCYSSSYTSLSQCFKYYYSPCGFWNDALGLVCYGSSHEDDCTNGDVRMMNGSTTNEGRVEYCSDGVWSPVCSLSSRTASLMCQKMGFTQFTWGLVINDERFGRSDKKGVFNYLYCSSSAATLSDCTEYNKGGGCYISESTCSTEYSLRCYNPGTCKDGDVRLADGAIEQEGRPEVCINGVWSTFCQWSWNSIDAFVFCNMLGYDGPSPTIYYNSYFGSGYGPPAYSYVYCQGWEQDIHDCTKTTYPSFSCPSTYIAGTICKEGCTTGDVRLVGGGFENEGTVEVCNNNLWGLVADNGWNEADAHVVCRKLGFPEGTYTPVLGSYYGKPNKTIHWKDVSCFGDEDDLSQCTKTVVSLTAGKKLLNITAVAGVDCVYDEPTPPPCIKNPTIDPSDACNTIGEYRLINNGVEANDEGRLEHCYTNGFWTPVCSLDGRAAALACKYFGYNQYYWGAVIETGEYGTLLNYSLVQNITCTGSESTFTECTVNDPEDNCLPWCPTANIGLKCFDSGKCNDGDIRLVDAIIEQEGRVEVCVNGVWGSICDNGWDQTDAHVICQQLGFPEEEPVVFYGSYFGDGSFPIVYSNMDCGGWEDSINDCDKTMYDDFTCPRSNVAGLLCGYDCMNGDVRLVGSDYAYEGMVEICFDNLWGLVENVGWTVLDGQVVCRQLGYEIEGTVASFTKPATIPDKTVHSSNVQCTGDEEVLSDCTQVTYSIHEGRDKRQMNNLQVAGVTCYTPDQCVPPPTDIASDCTPGDVRLSGDNAVNGVGTLEYCYNGRWSGVCSMGEREATVACRQLGYVNYGSVSIFNDGRFDSSVSNSSLFSNFSCIGDAAHLRLDQCDVMDGCQSTCAYPISIACSTMANCNEGDVRLVNGSIAQEGRVEVCHENIWGSVCGDNFDYTDAYVVCKELDFGVAEPVVYTNSKFGDGNLPVVYSNMGCQGFESTVVDCTKSVYGDFSCLRSNIAGVTCQDDCQEGDVRLVNLRTSDVNAGTLEMCYFNSWGLVSIVNWDDDDTTVACKSLGYDTGDFDTSGTSYGKPNISLHVNNVGCMGDEMNLTQCDLALVQPDEGKLLAASVNVVGISCTTNAEIERQTSDQNTRYGLTAGIILVAVLLVLSLVVVVSLVFYVLVLKKGQKTIVNDMRAGQVTMSGLQDTRSGFANPAAVGFGDDYTHDGPDEFEDEKDILASTMYDNVPRS